MAQKRPKFDHGGARSVNQSGVKSCLRALDIVHYFTRHDAPARTIDISEALGIPNSSADEILRTLATMGYLTFNRETKRYVPSYKLVATGRSIERNFFGGNYIGELLSEIKKETGATVYVTFQNDCWVENVAEMRGRWVTPDDEIDFPTEVILYDKDRWQPATNFAAAILAQHSNVEIIKLVTRAQQLGLGPSGPSLMKYLVDRIAQIRAKGFALCRRNDIVLDSIAVPLQLPNAVSPHAVGIVSEKLFESEGDIKRMASAMQAAVMRHRERLYEASAAQAVQGHC